MGQDEILRAGSSMSIESVIFDFAGVLCFPPADRQLSEAAVLCGLSTEEFVRAFWLKRRDYDRGQDAASYWQDIAGASGRTFDDAMIAGMVRREIEFWSRFDERVLRWTRQLRAAGLRTGILSNLPRPLGQALRAAPGFLDRFDQVTFSYELGVIKPEREIYLHAIEGLGAAPSQTLFLDDHADNVEGARAAGLQAVLFTTWEDFVARDRARFALPEPSCQTP